MSSQLMPAINPDGAGNAAINFLRWTGVPAAWAETIADTITLSLSTIRSIGAAISTVLAGGGPVTVDTCTVSSVTGGDSRAKVSLAWTGHAAIELDAVPTTKGDVYAALVALGVTAESPGAASTDVVPSYATTCAAGFAAV